MKGIFIGIIGLLIIYGNCFGQGAMMGSPMMGQADMMGQMMDMPPIPGGKWWKIPEVIEQLKVTSEEQAKLDELFFENERKAIDIEAGIRKERLELEQLFDQKELNEASCMEHFKKLVDKRIELGSGRFKYWMEVRKLLGYDRFQTLKSAQEKRMERFKEMKGKKTLLEKKDTPK